MSWVLSRDDNRFRFHRLLQCIVTVGLGLQLCNLVIDFVLLADESLLVLEVCSSRQLLCIKLSLVDCGMHDNSNDDPVLCVCVGLYSSGVSCDALGRGFRIDESRGVFRRAPVLSDYPYP